MATVDMKPYGEQFRRVMMFMQKHIDAKTDRLQDQAMAEVKALETPFERELAMVVLCEIDCLHNPGRGKFREGMLISVQGGRLQ